MQVQVEMLVSKETKRTKRYEEPLPQSGDAIIGTLYIPKRTLATIGNPTVIRVTVEAIG